MLDSLLPYQLQNTKAMRQMCMSFARSVVILGLCFVSVTALAQSVDDAGMVDEADPPTYEAQTVAPVSTTDSSQVGVSPSNNLVPEPQTDASQDPPSRVGRLNYVEGAVSVKPASQSDYSQAVSNRPLVHGDSVWTGEQGQAEIHIGAHVVRLAPQTAVTLTTLNDQSVQIALRQGHLGIQLYQFDEHEIIEVDTPNTAVNLQTQGLYRVDVNAAGDQTKAIVRQGKAEIWAAQEAFSLTDGQMGQLAGSSTPTHSVEAAPALDDFDRWCAQRAGNQEHPQALKYVSRSMVGYEDLDNHGSWAEEAEYGAIWYPRTVPVNWAPYRFGHWAFIPPWGWTWIDDAPWGFAPFHYGRWAFTARGWGWAPGPMWHRPCYAPALVGFVGAGAFGAGVAFGAATVAWFPLGWREPFIPGYHTSYGYLHRINVNQVNVTHINNLHPAYINRGVAGSVTVVNGRVFQHGGAIAPANVMVNRSVFEHAPVAFAPHVGPGSQGGPRTVGGPFAMPPAGVNRRPIFQTPRAAAGPMRIGPTGRAGGPSVSGPRGDAATIYRVPTTARRVPMAPTRMPVRSNTPSYHAPAYRYEPMAPRNVPRAAPTFHAAPHAHFGGGGGGRHR